jgi:hypothetical protein
MATEVPLCNSLEIAEVRDARAVLKKCGRLSRAGIYLAHSLVSRRYARDFPTGVEVHELFAVIVVIEHQP